MLIGRWVGVAVVFVSIVMLGAIGSIDATSELSQIQYYIGIVASIVGLATIIFLFYDQYKERKPRNLRRE